SLVYIAQGLAHALISTPVHLGVITNGLHALTAHEPVCAFQAPMLGPLKTIPQEYANVRCRCVDIGFPEDDAWSEALRGAITELTDTRGETIVAHRGSERYVREFHPAILPPARNRPHLLRKRGVYLITGGTGGVGLAVVS